MKKIFFALGLILTLFMAYVLLVPKFASQKSVEGSIVKIEYEEMASAGREPASIEILPEIITTGNDKITKVSIGDEDAQSELKIRSHVYTVIHTEDDLKKLEHTLSYVILPKNLSGHSDTSTAVYKRYVQVLEQIQELRKIDKSNIVRKSSPFPRTDNHFVLFKETNDDSRVTVENYNYELSYKVLDFFQAKYPDVRLEKEGPYIITTARNVMNGAEDFSFLYMNLSSFNNSAIKEAIESYKKRLVDKGNSDIERLEGWRYSLLSALTNFNADIHIVRSAVAGEL